MTPDAVPLSALRLGIAEEADLRWFFQGGDGESTGLRSSLGAAIDSTGPPSNQPTSSSAIDAIHGRLAASARAGIIRRRLARLSQAHQRVLESHYGTTGVIDERKAFGVYGAVASCTAVYRLQRGRGGHTLEAISKLACPLERPKKTDEQSRQASALAFVRKVRAEAEVLVVEASTAYAALLRSGA